MIHYIIKIKLPKDVLNFVKLFLDFRQQENLICHAGYGRSLKFIKCRENIFLYIFNAYYLILVQLLMSEIIIRSLSHKGSKMIFLPHIQKVNISIITLSWTTFVLVFMLFIQILAFKSNIFCKLWTYKMFLLLNKIENIKLMTPSALYFFIYWMTRALDPYLSIVLYMTTNIINIYLSDIWSQRQKKIYLQILIDIFCFEYIILYDSLKAICQRDFFRINLG